MRPDDVLDPETVSRIELEHDRDVNLEAYEVHLADLATMRMCDRLSQLTGRVEVELTTADSRRGVIMGALPDWLLLEVSGTPVLVSVWCIARLRVGVGTATSTGEPSHGPGSTPAQGSVGALLREHLVISGRLRLTFRDGQHMVTHLSLVCADFIVVGGGTWVPLHALTVIELL